MFGSVAVTGILFNHLIYNGSLRHFGIVFLAFLAGLWMLRARGALVLPRGVFPAGAECACGDGRGCTRSGHTHSRMTMMRLRGFFNTTWRTRR